MFTEVDPMKNLRRIFCVVVALMAVLTVVALNSVNALATLSEDGLAVPADAGISRLLTAGDGRALSLVDVGYEDVVYSSITGYYVGENRAAIDQNFPIYINSGTGLRFLNEEIWLVSAEVDLMRTYDGLYLADGYTYNYDLEQADAEEFILVALQNKLFMNAQAAVFENRITAHDIPANSVLSMTDSYIRWYYLDNNALVYAEEESVFDATLTIGGHTYEYSNLLRALALIEDAIQRENKNRPSNNDLQDIEDILNGGSGSHRDPTQGEIRPGDGAEDTQPGTQLPPNDGTLTPEDDNGVIDGDAEDSTTDTDQENPSEQPGADGPDVTEAPEVTEKPGTPDPQNPSGTDDRHDAADGQTAGGQSTGGQTDVGTNVPTIPGAGGDSTGSNPTDPTGSGSGSGSGDAPGGNSSGSSGQSGSISGGSGSIGGSGGLGGGGSSGGSGGSGNGGSDNDPDDGPDGEEDGKDDPSDDGGSGDASGDKNPEENPGEVRPPNPDEKPKPTTPMEYRDPVVEFKNIEAWTYALGGELEINDLYGAIQKGVKIGIYRRLDGDKALAKDEDGNAITLTDANGNPIKVYSAATNEGKSTVIRRTFVGSQTIAMSPVPPNTTIYVQLYYRYNKETAREKNDDGTWNLTFERKTYYSDFYELKTAEIDGFVEAIQANWTTVFAGQDTSMVLDNLSIANTSDYDPTLVGDQLQFSNFKKDTLPYIHRMEYVLTPLGDNGQPKGEAVTLTASSSVMNKAKLQGGTVFISSAPKLDSNTRYSVTVVAKDRWSNTMPLKIVGADDALIDYTEWKGTVFTRKAAPKVTVEETANVTDKLTVKITISDTDDALAKDGDGNPLPLKLTALNSAGEPSSIYGRWVKIGNKPDTSAFGSENVGELELPAPEHGKTYELTLESLAFAQLYTIRVTGSYDPQPTANGASDAGSLERMNDQILGSVRSYTASLTNGNVNFTSSVVNLLDTSGTVQMTMNDRSTTEILPLVDEFRFTLAEKASGKVIKKIVLKMSELDTSEGFTYDASSGSVILKQGGGTEPTVRLIGTEAMFMTAGKNPWQAMLVKLSHDEDKDEDVTIPAMTIAIDIPTDTMKTSTRHTMTMESVVIKSGIEYQIPTSLSVSEFTTRKIQPALHYDDLFIAGEVMEYLGLWIEDPDGTINEDNGLVYAYLYFGETRLQARELHANEDAQSLRFEGLIPGADYSLRFVAKSFNDAEGFTNQVYNKELWRYDFKGGSFLNGSLNLVGLEYTERTGLADSVEVFHITGEQFQAALQLTLDAGYKLNEYGEWNANPRYRDYWYEYNTDRYISPILPVDGSTVHFLHLIDYFPQNAYNVGDANVTFRFYKSEKLDRVGELGWQRDYNINTRSGNVPLVAVPEDAKYFRIWINGREYVKENGFTLLGYTQEKGENYAATIENHGGEIIEGKYLNTNHAYIVNASYNVFSMLPVKPGEVYAFGDAMDWGAYVHLYSESGAYMGYVTVSPYSMFKVPTDVYYISGSYSGVTQKHHMYRVSAANISAGYDASVDVEVRDAKGYLNAIETPWVVLKLYRSESIKLPEFPEKPIMEQRVNLVPEDADIRADKSLWASYDGAWIPDAGEDGEFTGVLHLIQQELSPNAMYRLTLSADYKGSLVVLDTIEFQTDGEYDTIKNNAEMKKILRNPYGNYLVTADFEHYLDLGEHITLRGSIDFQGHVITRRENTAFPSGARFFIYGNAGTIRNLVYDYPKASHYTNVGAVLYNNTSQGLLENVIVRTQGTVHLTTSDRGLLCCSNTGTIRNFVVKLGGDLRLHGNTNTIGGVFYSNTGTIEDGYVYAPSGYGVLLYADPTYTGNPYYGGLICANYRGATIRNVYTIYDTWFSKPESPVNNSRALVGWYDSTGKYLDSYHVGDYYEYTGWVEGSDKTYTSRYSSAIPLTAERQGGGVNSGLSYFTDFKYAGLKDSYSTGMRGITQQPIKGLRDAEWQKKTLGDAFDVDGCVPMGFYPRLKTLPNELQKYQEYIQIPTRSEGAIPVPTSDDWADDYGYDKHGNESGVIRLVFQNDRGVTIQNLVASYISGKKKIETLELTILRQQATKDGLWEVFVDAKALEYRSDYVLTDMTYSAGGATVTVEINYKLQNIEFWKEIRTTADWQAINDHMNWNYRVMNNIDFKNVTALAALTIDGSRTAAGGSAFSGKLDGGMYTLSNISLKNTERPWVFYYLGSHGEVRNLVFDNLTLTSSDNIPSGNSYVAPIRYLYFGARVDNVHVRNSRYEGVGQIGGIVAYSYGCYITNSSTANTTLYDRGGSAEVYVGGVVANTNWYGSIQSCYVRDITIDARNSAVISSVGGVVGRADNHIMHDIYATGTITTKATNVGGVVGWQLNSGGALYNSWADVKIDSYSSNGSVGEIVGYSNASTVNALALGSILSVSPDSTHRIIGKSDNPTDYMNKNQSFFAYTGQTVNSNDKNASDQARRLLDETTLCSRGTWTDTLALGKLWSYDPVTQTQPAFPKLLKYGTGELLWGQEDISLPEPGDFELRIDRTEVKGTDANAEKTVECTILHPGLDMSDKKKWTEAKLKNYFKISIDGMGMTDIDFQNNNAAIAINGGNGSTSFAVRTKRLEKALDYYRMTVTVDGKRDLNAQVYYGRPFYWDIPNLATWNKYVASTTAGGLGHGYTGENFRITGLIDFEGGTTQYTGLRLGRLEGPEGYAWKDMTIVTPGEPAEPGDEASDVTANYISVRGQGDDHTNAVGFTNLNYLALGGTPWIDSVDHAIERLYFKTITGDFTNAPIDRARSGMVLMSGGIHDVVFDGITMKTVYNSSQNIGFVSNCEGSMERVSAEHMSMSAVKAEKGNRGYVGSVAARVVFGFTEVEAKDIVIDMTNITNGVAYVGGVVGYASQVSAVNQYKYILTGTFENITVRAWEYVGGFAGSMGRSNIDGITVRNVEIHGSRRGQGAFCGYTGPYNYHQDILVSGCQVYDDRAPGGKDTWGDIGAGGYIGYIQSIHNTPIRRLRVENTTVKSNYYAGGVSAYLGSMLRDAEVVGCTITATEPAPESGKAPYTSYPIAAGGVCASLYATNNYYAVAGVVVRNTTVTGRSQVGGIAGGGTANIYNCYVAPDVEVKATGTHVVLETVDGKNTYRYTEYSGAGGIVGASTTFNISNCISGAKVYASGAGAGGIVGVANFSDSAASYDRLINNCIFAGEEVRADGGYAGGIIGMFRSPTVPIPESSIANVVIATNVVGGDGKNSLWVNDMSTVNLTNHNFNNIFIWDHSTVNGQLASDVERAAAATETDPYAARPKNGELVSAAAIGTREFYIDHGFTEASKSEDPAEYTKTANRGNWDLRYLPATDVTDESDPNHGNRFFPYPAFNNWDGTSSTDAARKGALKSNPVLELARWADASLFDANGAPQVWKPAADSVADGVLLPIDGATNPSATVVYATGIDTITVETNTPNGTVTLGGVELTTDANGAASMTYDFNSTLALSGTSTTYTAEELCRDTLVVGSYWYFIDKWTEDKQPTGNEAPVTGALRVGEYSFMTTETATATKFVMVKDSDNYLTNVVHLWGNKALTADGSIYTLTGYTAAKDSDDPLTMGAKAEAQPFRSYTYGPKNTSVKLFHNFTLYGDVRLDGQRIYQLDGTLYPLSASKNYIYDGILLISEGAEGSKVNYFAVGDKDGGLTSYLAAIRCSNWTSTGIKQMSNTFGTSSPIVVLRYDDGRVCVVNFSANLVAYNSHKSGGALAYVGEYLSALFASSDDEILPQDYAYALAMEEAASYCAIEDGTQSAWDGDSDGGLSDDDPDGDASIEGDASGDGSGVGGEIGEPVDGSGVAADDPTGEPIDGDGGSTGEPSNGELGGDGAKPTDTGTEPDAPGEFVDGENTINGEGGPDGEGAAQPGNSVGDEPSGDSWFIGGNLVEGGEGASVGGEGGLADGEIGAATATDETALPETIYVQPESGKLYSAKPTGGIAAISADSVSFDEKSGTYSVSGMTYYPDTTTPPPASIPKAVTLVSKEVHTRKLMSELGAALVAYDPVTGEYGAYLTETLLSDAPRKTTDSTLGKQPDFVDLDAEEQGGDSSFTVGHGLGRDLTATEQRGFTLLILAAVAALGLLSVVFVKVKNRKR